MNFVFGEFELDTKLYEIRRAGEAVRVEPQAFNLLHFLILNRERAVTRDEIVDEIWDGRIVSEAAISTCIKAARQAVDDSGSEQRWIKTVRGRGFRFVGQVSERSSVARVYEEPDGASSHPQQSPSQRIDPSIAVLPFDVIGDPGQHAAISEALAHDVIQAISRLRWLRVISRGSAFRFRSGDGVLDKVKTNLGVRYCLTGLIEVVGPNIIISVELFDLVRNSGIWIDRFEGQLDEIHELRARIVEQTVASIETQISQYEARVAQATTTENLDAWAAFHIGLVSMYRFTEVGTSNAIRMFQRAVALDPLFARAHAGLSFAHFQNAFNAYPDVDREGAVKVAFASSERALELDALDPFCNFVKGRAHWLTGDVDLGLGWLDRALEINPNFAQGHYAMGIAALMAGKPFDTHGAADRAQALSPIDPLLYGFYGVRAFTFIAEGNYPDAAIWANRAATAPGALPVMDLLAVVANELAGDRDFASKWAERARARNPGINAEYFFRALPFHSGAIRKAITSALDRHGF